MKGTLYTLEELFARNLVEFKMYYGNVFVFQSKETNLSIVPAMIELLGTTIDLQVHCHYDDRYNDKSKYQWAWLKSWFKRIEE